MVHDFALTKLKYSLSRKESYQLKIRMTVTTVLNNLVNSLESLEHIFYLYNLAWKFNEIHLYIIIGRDGLRSSKFNKVFSI